MVTMLIHPQWNPIALQLGPLAVHWYGISYLAAFGLFFFLALRRSRQPAMAHQGWSREIIEDLLFYGVLGVILGGRLGYCLFYKPGYYALHPLEVLAVWQGGMSFHGGMLGVIAAMAYLQVAALGREGEPVERTVFYFSLGATVSGALCMLLTGTSEWVWPQAWLLIPMGILAALGQWCMTRAYNDGATMVVANLQYAGIVFSALFGLFLFGDQIPFIGWAGICVIVLSAIAATALRARSTVTLPVEDH